MVPDALAASFKPSGEVVSGIGIENQNL